MLKKISIIMGALLTLALIGFSIGSASASAVCVPHPETTEVIHHDAVTHVVHHDAVTHVVHHDAVTHVVHHDAVTHVVHHDAVTHVVHHEGVPAGPDLWWNWSPNKYQGPFEGPPSFPTDSRGTWEGPHENGGPSQDTFGTFQQGNGNGSWFHREHGTPGVDPYDETVIDQPAYDETVIDQEAYDETVVDQEAYDETVVDSEAYDETVVDQEAYDETVVHPAVECPPTEPPTDTPTPPVDTPTPPVVVTHNPPPAAPPAQPAPPVTKKAPPVPTVVEAGL